MNERPQLIAIDVDGTLVPLDQRVRDDVIDAIEALTAKGVHVCLATGRNLTETLPVWSQLRLASELAPIVTNGGALVSEPDTGRTLFQQPIEADLAGEFAQSLLQAGRSVAMNVDRWRWGLDVMVIESADIDHVRQRWFDRMDALRIKVVQAPPTASLDQPDVLRINAVLDAEDVQQIIPPLQEQFQDRLTLHGIVAPNYGVYFLEAFAVGVDKWSAVNYIAQGLGIGPGKVAAIGDDINDLPMIVGAGLGLAMPDASQSVRQQADRIAQAGLAEVLRDLLP